jgi:hypothetical protein
MFVLSAFGTSRHFAAPQNLSAIGGIADIENCRWKVSHRWHDCALKKTW